MRRKSLLPLALLLVLPAHAHIGSPDTFVQATAGPYKFLIAAHPPAAYPGALELDFRFDPDDHITAATASLDSAAPTPIQIFDAGTATATLWLPTPAAHTIHIAINGNGQGSTYDLTLPSAAIPTPAAPVSRGPIALWTLLAIVFAAAAVVLAIRKPRHIGYAALLTLPACLLAAFASHLARSAHTQPPSTTITSNLTPDGTLDFTLANPSEHFSDIVPDHRKLLHLFLIRQPQQDVFLHLHPHQLTPGHFTVSLPAMPPGTYQLFADYYLAPHGDLKNARNETPTLTLTLPAQFHSSAPPDPDDTSAVLPLVNAAAQLNYAAAQLKVDRADSPSGLTTWTAHLLDAYTLQLTAPTALHLLHANLLKVTLLDPSGHAPPDMALYLNMPAHAVVLRSDNAVFAHIHPGGTLPMLSSASTMNMSMPMDMPMPTPSNTATIPYGFPSAGRYRIFVQMKHGPIVETAAFDLTVN